ncbi:MAG: cytochrome c3 family protein [Thermodesulfobacteriota bacterium]
MSKPRRILVRVAGVAASMLFSASSLATITGSMHDFSARGYGTDEICVFCHTPHNAKTPQLAPLWNHATTVATYTLYSSPTMNVPVGQPGNASKSCLSCHDGSVAIDSYGSRTGTNLMPGTPGIPGSPNLGIDLSDDHPVGIQWVHQTCPTGPGSEHCCTLECHTSLDPDGMPFYGTYHNRYMECATCHEPHLKYSNPKMLRRPLAGSEICLTCHAK